jgi:hypothetical protein
LTPAELEKAFDLNDQLRNVDAIFDRVFRGELAVAPAGPERGVRAITLD